ncbi:MAG: hypothetical protein A2521_16150 [Deltaproteobacteria bacterium RIFOXYD12_FULL_57_12]|nr:MAG: hypothetical protein A2521_16150 [Deltaproteobacteria bacterium RIFOXYD12_FULL_57_12]
MKIVIVGAGAIGRVFGVFLSRGGHEVIFIEIMPDVVEAINRDGVGIMDIDMVDIHEMAFVKARAVADAREIADCDAVILAVKSFDTSAAIHSVVHLVTASSPILSLQTGLGNLEIMEQVVSRENIIGGFTFMAGTALLPGRVKHGGVGTTYIGELDGRITPRIERLRQAFNESGLVAQVVKRIVGRLWSKVIVYSAINSVSAVLRVKNGQLLETMESVTLLKRLIDEGQAVAEAQGIDLVYQDLYELLFSNCERTARNMSSMLQDVINQRRTEVDAQNGGLCRYGSESRVPTTTQQTMFELVRLIERWGQDSYQP